MSGVALRRADRARGGTRAQIYSALRDAIVSAELEPGRQLSENELATWLGVSRTPVREALVSLREDRLVEIVPQLGTFVSPISLSAVEDAQFVREALECAAVRQAATEPGHEDVLALEGLIARQREVGAGGDAERFFVLDDEFHSALCASGGREIAWVLSQRAKSHLDRVRRLSLPQPRYLDEMVAEHGLVVRAIKRGDPDAAEDALRHHLRMVLSALPEIRSQHPSYFEEG